MNEVTNLGVALDYVINNPIPAWAAVVSTSLAAIKIWETFWRDRIRLAVSYSLSGERGGQHEITVANLSSVPVQISSWDLTWKPRWFAFWLKEVNVSPQYTYRFKIMGHDSYQINFEGRNQFAWGWKIASGRQLVLELNLFGRKRPLRLRVGAGQAAIWWRKVEALVPRRQCKPDDLEL
ncbi:hypothetical protein ATO2_18900 [Roseovarius sp. 22II1-1F6A]|nr:hypothetical protein ATO2_18900 [Roseovarius sp. 22II1-1F6A]